MKKKLVLTGIALTLLLIIAGYISVHYYSYVFAKTINGEIVRVERVNQPGTIINGSGAPASQLFSFAVAIRGNQGEIHTASSEDRQWAVAEKGQCAQVKFFPYPPWELDKANTYYGARLERLYDCKQKP